MEEQKVEKVKEKEHDFRNIMLTIVGVFVVLAAVSGGTFAYFAYSASNNTTINGTAATTNLTLTVTKISPTTDGALVPQLKAGLNSAVKNGCIDGRSNKVCQVYSITVTNGETASISVGAGVTFTYKTGSFQNLRWATLSGAPTATNTTAGSAVVPVLDSNYTSLVASSSTSSEVIEIQNKIGTAVLGGKDSSTASKTWYIVVWIEELGSAQDSLDNGTFTGTIRINDSSGKGLTSTFTS